MEMKFLLKFYEKQEESKYAMQKLKEVENTEAQKKDTYFTISLYSFRKPKKGGASQPQY